MHRRRFRQANTVGLLNGEASQSQIFGNAAALHIAAYLEGRGHFQRFLGPDKGCDRLVNRHLVIDLDQFFAQIAGNLVVVATSQLRQFVTQNF